MNRLLDCYKILEVSFGAPREDVASSYKRLCRRYHPDVNDAPGSEEHMKQINMAYAFLCDKWSAEEKIRSRGVARSPVPDTQSSATEEAAHLAMDEYFRALMTRSYKRAYHLLSDHDKRYVTYASFCDWRESVEKLFTMQSFFVDEYDVGVSVKLKDGRSIPSRKCFISVTEKNRTNGKLQNGKYEKLAVFERGSWHVFLGYKDLDTIVRTFQKMIEQNRREEMERSWEERRAENCDELGILSVKGFHKQAKRDLYAYKRYHRPFVIAALSVEVLSPLARKRSDQIMQVASESVCARLRETDLAAYAGNGTVLVLFSEMKKRYAGTITKRLAEAVKKDILDALGIPIRVEFAFSPYEGGPLEQEVDKVIKDINRPV